MPVISIENVSKLYRLGMIGTGTLAHDLNRWWARVRGREDPYAEIGQVNDRTQEADGDYVWALKDINLEVHEGEVLGIIGANGAGKSTLLKLISRITSPTSGVIKAKGRVASLLEVGTGMHPEMTARENIYLNGAILGMKKREIAARFDDIVDFAGCAMYVDTPFKRYSSGMRVRLGFAVAAFLEPEILIVDEVLAVGDAEFQKKAIGKMQDVSRTSGRTILFVSHNMGAINQLCPKSIWIDAGRVVLIDDSASVVASYLRKSVEFSGQPIVEMAEDREKDVQLRRVRLLNERDENAVQFSCDAPIITELLLQVNRRVPGLYGYLVVSRADGAIMIEADSSETGQNPLECLQPGSYLLTMRIPPRILAAGEYRVQLNLAVPGQTIDRLGEQCSFCLDDITSKRGSTRRSYLSTIPSWELRKTEEPRSHSRCIPPSES